MTTPQADALRMLDSDEIELVMNDGYRNAAGGIYTGSVHQFARDVQLFFAEKNGLIVSTHQPKEEA